MAKLKVCKLHPDYKYTLKDKCPECKKPSTDAHYKFLKLGSLNDNQEKE